MEIELLYDLGHVFVSSSCLILTRLEERLKTELSCAKSCLVLSSLFIARLESILKIYVSFGPLASIIARPDLAVRIPSPLRWRMRFGFLGRIPPGRQAASVLREAGPDCVRGEPNTQAPRCCG